MNWEAVSTELSASLTSGNCYGIGLVLARSLNYKPNSRTTGKYANYTAPTRLRIWGGNTVCDRAELLAEPPLIHNNKWEIYTFKLAPQKNDYTHLILEVHYQEYILSPTNGNLLLDAVTDITQLTNCDLDTYTYSISTTVNDPAKQPLLVPESNPFGHSTLDVGTSIGTLNLHFERYYRSEGRVKEEITEALDNLLFNDQQELLIKHYRLKYDEDGPVFFGNPSVISIKHAIEHSKYKEWELVVYDEDLEKQIAKIAELKTETAGKFPGLVLHILSYQTKIHKRVNWDCVSIKGDLFMRALN